MLLAPGHKAATGWNGILLPKGLNCQCPALALIFLLVPVAWEHVRIFALVFQLDAKCSIRLGLSSRKHQGVSELLC